MRTRNTTLNLICDILPQILIIIIAFFKSKIFLTYLGDNIVGLYNYLNQIIAYLSIAELGLTSAVMYYLYSPIRNKDYFNIAKIINGAKYVFKIIMIIIIVIGIILLPFIPSFIKNLTLSRSFVMIIFLIILITNALTYFSTPFIITFDSHQKKYKYIFWYQLLIIIRNILSILFVFLFKNLLLVVLLECLISIIQNILIRFLYKKNFSNIYKIKTKEKNMEFTKKIKSLVPHRIGYVVSQNIDIVLITGFMGLDKVAVYTCYNYIINCFNVLIGRMSSAILASVGDLITEKKEGSYSFFLEYNGILNFMAIILVCPLFIVFNDFIEIWYGKQYLLSWVCVLFFCLMLYYNIIRICLTTFSSGDGLFKETLICVWTEVIINLFLSIVLLRYIGILGLIIGTFAAMIFGEFAICPHILNKNIFKDKISKYYLDCLVYFVILVLNTFIFLKLYSFFDVNSIYSWLLVSVFIFSLNFVLCYIEFKIIKKDAYLDRVLNLIRRKSK